jgi:hypothetical protein
MRPQERTAVEDKTTSGSLTASFTLGSCFLSREANYPESMRHKHSNRNQSRQSKGGGARGGLRTRRKAKK